MLEKLLDQKYMYGGEIMKLGDIIIDLQNIYPNQRCVDRYLQGLLLTQEPIKPLRPAPTPKYRKCGG